MTDAILSRRSVRKYNPEEVSEEKIKKVLEAGIAAPSAKNRQPWKFVVVRGSAKAEMLAAMEKGILREREGNGILPDSICHSKSALFTHKIMEQAPVTIFILNPLGKRLTEALDLEERIYEICNMQSIGAAIENMTLEAVNQGLGSLWICDIFFAYEELTEWLNEEGELTAALSLGYAAENPGKRPRMEFDQVVKWRSK